MIPTYSQSTVDIPRMWPILPYDIIVQIIDTVGEDKDLLKELALVSHSFHEIANTYLPPSNFTSLIHSAASRNHSSIYLKADQTLSNISANSHIKWAVTTTTIFGSHTSFQNSSEQFLVSTTSQSTVRVWTGIHGRWTLPWDQRSFTLCIFLPLITSISHISEISHCLFSLHVSICFGSIYAISNHSKSKSLWRSCQKFVNSILQILPCWRRSCYML